MKIQRWEERLVRKTIQSQSVQCWKQQLNLPARQGRHSHCLPDFFLYPEFENKVDRTSSVIIILFVFEMQRVFQTAYIFEFQYKDDGNLALLQGWYLWSLCNSASTNTSYQQRILSFRDCIGDINTVAMVGQVMILNWHRTYCNRVYSRLSASYVFLLSSKQ